MVSKNEILAKSFNDLMSDKNTAYKVDKPGKRLMTSSMLIRISR
jgi:hypothetical protein